MPLQPGDQAVKITHTVNGVFESTITLTPDNVPRLVAAQLENAVSFEVTHADGRVVRYEREGDWG